jgi:hypothetical protein
MKSCGRHEVLTSEVLVTGTVVVVVVVEFEESITWRLKV